MSFQFEDSMIHNYWTEGYAVFRGIVPASLLKDLRVEADKARALAAEVNGPQCHRLQPVSRYEEHIDQKPFQEYCELPELASAVERLLGKGFTHGHRDIIGILVEPKIHTWTQGWHRDGLVEVPRAAQNEPDVIACQQERWLDRRTYNQINCAIYRDAALWFVPGSHLRMNDLPGEMQSTGVDMLTKDDNTSEEDFERLCLDHARNFPRARQVLLEPGDFMIYRNNGWHCAHLVKYQPRATMHDSCLYHGDVDFEYDWGEVSTRMREKYPGPY